MAKPWAWLKQTAMPFVRSDSIMPKTSKTFQTAQNVLDNDTAAENWLVQALDRFQQLVWVAAGDGEISAPELKQITTCVRMLRQVATKSLNSNRLIASLLCAEAGGLKLDDPRTLTRLPALRLLPARELEEDLIA